MSIPQKQILSLNRELKMPLKVVCHSSTFLGFFVCLFLFSQDICRGFT